MTEQTKRTVTLKRGAPGEHEVPVDEIQVPDLWHIAQALKKSGEKVYVAVNGEFTWVLAGDYVLDCWHLTHDLVRHIRDEEEAKRRPGESIPDYVTRLSENS